MNMIIRDFENRESILDTKYKLLDDRDYPKFKISQSDMYQMLSYAVKSGCKNLVLIYHKIERFNENIKYDIKSPFIEDEVQIKVLMVSFKIDYKTYSQELDLFKLQK